MQSQHLFKIAFAAAGATLLLSACEPQAEDLSAGQRLDQSVSTVKQGAQEAGKEAGKVVQAATERATSTVEDAAITASINAELAKDAELSALKINVDTREGRVVLQGSAPNAAARERATRLATAIKGVQSVDNRLEVRA